MHVKTLAVSRFRQDCFRDQSRLNFSTWDHFSLKNLLPPLSTRWTLRPHRKYFVLVERQIRIFLSADSTTTPTFSTSGSETTCTKKMGEIFRRVSGDRRMNVSAVDRNNVQNKSVTGSVNQDERVQPVETCT